LLKEGIPIRLEIHLLFSQNFKTTNMNTTSFDDLLDKFIGLPGTSKRNKFDQKSRLFILGVQIMQIRQDQSLSKKKLSKMSGVTKSMISKIENNLGKVRLGKLLKVVRALNAKLYFDVEV
jgi:HTH-type transcriptional regulator/antitoxin HipB